MSVAHSLLREIINLDNLYYNGRDLPSSLLPNEAEIYLEAFGETRANIKTPTDYNFVAKAELAWDHFTDVTGEYEMFKTLKKTIISKY